VAADLQWTIQSPSERSGLYAVDNLNPSALTNSSVNGPVRNYLHDMIGFLEKLGYVEGQNLFAFPYDWRDSILNTANKLAVFLKKVAKDTGASQVNVVSHSMGGYVTKTALVSDPSLKNLIDIYVSFATPWQGTGKEWVTASLFGSNLNNRKLDPLVVRDVTLGSIAHYERMLINIEGENNLGAPSLITVNGVKVTSLKMVDALNTFLKDNTVYYGADNSKSVSVPFRKDIFEKIQSNTVLKQIWDANLLLKQRQPLYFYNIIGENIDTPVSVSITGEGISVDGTGTVTITNFSSLSYESKDMISGDGLTTAASVTKDGFSATQRINLYRTHNGLLKYDAALLAMKYYLNNYCHVLGAWNVTMEDASGMKQQTITISEGYNWEASSNTFDMKGRFFSDVFQGSFNYGGFNSTFNLDLSGNSDVGSECFFTTMEGTYRANVNNSKSYRFTGQKVPGSGSECTTDKSCNVDNGKGTQQCLGGYYSNICLVTSCNDGYRIEVGQPVSLSRCVIDMSNDRWTNVPIIIACLVGAFIVLSLIGIIFCFVKVRSSRSKRDYQNF